MGYCDEFLYDGCAEKEIVGFDSLHCVLVYSCIGVLWHNSDLDTYIFHSICIVVYWQSDSNNALSESHTDCCYMAYHGPATKALC